MPMSQARKVELIDLIAKNQFQINVVVEESDDPEEAAMGFLSVMPAMDGEESEEFEFDVAEGQEESYLSALEKALENWGREHARGTIFWQRKKTCDLADAEKAATLDFLARSQMAVSISLDGMSDDGREQLGLLSVLSSLGGEASASIQMVDKKGDMDSYMEALAEALDDWDEGAEETIHAPSEQAQEPVKAH